MSTPEQELLRDIVERIATLRASISDARDLAGQDAPDFDAFLALDKVQRVASNGLIKSVEQLEDQLARLFLTLLRILAVDTSGWFAQDTANQMARIGIVADADEWVRIVKLRNRLVHDYPLKKEDQHRLLIETYGAATTLDETAIRTIAYLTEKGLI